MKQSQALTVLKSGRNVFLTGEAGSGKSYTIRQFIKYLDHEDISYSITASTGIAGTQIGGTTIHSWSGIGIGRKLTKKDVQRILKESGVHERITHTQVLIIDEVSMIEAQFLDDLRLVIETAFGNGLVFGGVQIVLVGDFFQLPPVSKSKRVKFAFESRAWSALGLVICYLTEQHRQGDGELLQILTDIRYQNVGDETAQRLMRCKLTELPETRLFARNSEVDYINDERLAGLTTDPHRYVMTSNGDARLVAGMIKSCLSPEYLVLKEGAVVMFTRNNPHQGYVNGTIGKVIGFNDYDNPIVETLDGSEIVVKRAEWSIKKKGLVVASITQMPLKLAWAITIHKSQGMTLDSVRINLSQVFEFGQGYVALSRVKSIDGLHVDGIVPKSVFALHPVVLEVDPVFREQSERLAETLEESEMYPVDEVYETSVENYA